jgi:surface polysaccharide O-acyltransferase-like enzyme
MLQWVRALPVLVSALAVFAIGALWYSPVLFGKQWAAAHGLSEEKLQARRASAGRAYAVSFLCYVVMAVAMSVLIGRIGVTMWQGGVKLGALIGLGFAATISLTANMFSDKPLAAYLIDAGYQVVYLIVMGIILAAWR